MTTVSEPTNHLSLYPSLDDLDTVGLEPVEPEPEPTKPPRIEKFANGGSDPYHLQYQNNINQLNETKKEISTPPPTPISNGGVAKHAAAVENKSSTTEKIKVNSSAGSTNSNFKFASRKDYVKHLKSMKFVDSWTPKHRKGPDHVLETRNIWTSDIDGATKIFPSDFREPPVSIVSHLQRVERKYPKRTALAVKRSGVWKVWSYKQYYIDVCLTAKAFMKLGLEPNRSVSILGFNSPEWFLSDLGAIFAGGIATGVYTTNSSEACHFVISDSMSQIVVVEDQKQLEKILEIRDRLPHVKAIVQYIGEPTRPDVLSWSDLMEIGKTVPDKALNKRIEGMAVNQCCTLVYTSGTTGNPKGVMISHDNITFLSRVGWDVVDQVGKKQRVVSYLPLSHIASQLLDIHAPIQCASEVYFAQPDALKGSLKDTILEVRPTFFFGVPRVYEKMYTALREKENSLGFPAKMIFRGARKIGSRRNSFNHNTGGGGLPALPLGYRLASPVYKKIRKEMGFDKTNIFLTGAAPIEKEILDYFDSIGICILECYGLSETGACVSNSLYFRKSGTVGKIFPAVEIKLSNIDNKGEGEVCLRGRNVFMGYIHAPEKTREVIDDDGWCHSGDLGTIDDKGFVQITGRIKELVITAGGENVAPVYIEDNIKKELPILSNAMVVGDRRKFLSILLTLKTDTELNAGIPLDTLAPISKDWCRSHGVEAETIHDVIKEPTGVLRKAIQAGIETANKHAISNAQKIQKFTILPVDFSIVGGEFGPTLKLRRPIVLEKYKDVIDSMY